MTQTIIRAVYRDGVFVPLDKVELPEETEVAIPLKRALTREEIEARLRAAGLLEEDEEGDVEDDEELTPEERDRIGRKLAATGNSLDWINEEREERL